MIDPLPPAVILIVGALLVPCFKGRFRSTYLLAVPTLVFVDLLRMPPGTYWTVGFLDYELVFGRVDKLSMAFGIVFVPLSLQQRAEPWRNGLARRWVTLVYS